MTIDASLDFFQYCMQCCWRDTLEPKTAEAARRNNLSAKLEFECGIRLADLIMEGTLNAIRDSIGGCAARRAVAVDQFREVVAAGVSTRNNSAVEKTNNRRNSCPG